MRCPRCDKTISQKDRFCRYCGNAVTPDVIQASRLREDERWHGLLARRIVAQCAPASGTWGAHIYESDSASDHPRSRPRGCPEWVAPGDWDRWFHEGVVVWDNATQRIGAIPSAEAVQLLETLLSNDEWKATGIPVIERTRVVTRQPASPTKQSKNKVGDPEPPTEQRKEEWREDERLRLRGAAAEEFCAFLRTHEALLRRMAADREQRSQEAIQHVWEMLFRWKNERDAKEIELAGRAFPWQRQSSGGFVADVPPDRATIKLMESGLWWQPIIERPGHFKLDFQHFLSLEEALTWAESEIPRLRREDEEAARKRDEEEAADLARVAALDTLDLTPFWIDPAALEPTHITYRAYIELYYGPAASEKEEISFGEYWHFNQKYFTAAQLAVELRLNPAQVGVEQLIPEMEMYRIYSRVTYPDAPLAAAQAQQIWDQSAILERFAEKKVERARFGYQEIETSYCVWLGWVEQKPWLHWTRQKSRPEYMKDRAMGEMLSTALDVNGYRKYFQVGFNLMSDDDLLWKLHYHRSQSKFAPANLRAESQKWLQDHPRESLSSKSQNAKAATST
jgi:hypothetical protein